MTLHIYQGENPTRESLNSEHLCPKCKSTHINKRNFTKAQITHQLPHNNSGSLQHLTLINGQVIETETKQRYSQTKIGYEPNGFNKYLQNISP